MGTSEQLKSIGPFPYILKSFIASGLYMVPSSENDAETTTVNIPA